MLQLQHLLVLFAVIIIFNIIYSGTLFLKYSNWYYRTQFFAWLGVLVTLVLEGLAEGSAYVYRVLALSSFFFGMIMFAEILASITDIPFRRKPFIWVFSIGVMLTLILNHFGAGPSLMALPAIFTLSLPMLFTGFRALFFKGGNRISFVARCYAGAVLFFALHCLDYIYAIDKPELIFTGFTVGLLTFFGISTFSIAAALEKMTLENAEIKMEMKYRATLENAARLASLGEMAGGIAHEINTPLATIQMNAEFLIRTNAVYSGDQNSVQEKIQVISKTVNRIAKIILGLRSFARDAGNDPMIDTSLSEIVRSTLQLCEERFRESGIEIQLRSLGEGRVHCRPVQVSQALLNLLSNTFEAAAPNTGSKWVKIEIQDGAPFAKLIVSDNGKGISPEIRGKIFQPFFTTKAVGTATGLGLSVSLGNIEANGGTLVLDSDAPNTTFVISLPTTSKELKR